MKENKERQWVVEEVAYWALIGSPNRVAAEQLMFSRELPRVGERLTILPYTEATTIAAIRAAAMSDAPSDEILLRLSEQTIENKGITYIIRNYVKYLFSKILFHNEHQGTYRVSLIEHRAEPCLLASTRRFQGDVHVRPLHGLQSTAFVLDIRTQTDLPLVYLKKVKERI